MNDNDPIFPVVNLLRRKWDWKNAHRPIRDMGLAGRAKIAKGPNLRGTYAVVFADKAARDAYIEGCEAYGMRASIPTSKLFDYRPEWRRLANDDGKWPWE